MEVGAFGYGAKRIRTADPLNAIEVLYQLSYSPRAAHVSEIYYGSVFGQCQPLANIFLSPVANQVQGI